MSSNCPDGLTNESSPFRERQIFKTAAFYKRILQVERVTKTGSFKPARLWKPVWSPFLRCSPSSDHRTHSPPPPSPHRPQTSLKSPLSPSEHTLISEGTVTWRFTATGGELLFYVKEALVRRGTDLSEEKMKREPSRARASPLLALRDLLS